MKYYLREDGKKVGGLFEITKTNKGFKIVMLEKPYFMLGASESAFNNKTKSVLFADGKKTQHAVQKLGNDEYCIYFYQSGIPCLFKNFYTVEEELR